MDWNYIRRILTVFLSSFVVCHICTRSMPFQRQIQWSMLAVGIYIVVYIVKILSGEKV